MVAWSSSSRWQVRTSSSDDEIASWSADEPDDYVEDQNNNLNLPEELLLRIFGYMTPKDLSQIRAVCKSWKRIGSSPSLKISFLKTSFKEHLQDNYPNLPIKVIDECDWRKFVDLEKFGLCVDDAPVINYTSTIKKLIDLSNLQIEGNAGGTLFLKPKGISLTKLNKIASRKRKYLPDFSFSDYRRQLFNDEPIENSCWVWVANGIIKGSRNDIIGIHKLKLRQVGCELPSVLDVSILAFLKYVTSGGLGNIFNGGIGDYLRPSGETSPTDKTYTNCRESRERNIIAGSSIPEVGITIFYTFRSNETYIGAAPSLRF